MKKHNKYFVKFLFVFSFLVIFLVGCTSLPAKNIISPLNLLSDTNNYYCSVPTDFDDDLFYNLLSSYVENFQTKDLNLLKKYVSKIYIGLINPGQINTYEIVLSGNFPLSFIESSLKKNKKISKLTYLSEVTQKKYRLYEINGLKINLLSKNIILISSDVENLIQNYENPVKSFNQEIYDFLDYEEEPSSVKLCINTNQFIKDFSKALNIDYLKVYNFISEFKLYDTIVPCEDDDSIYINNFDLYFQNTKTAKLIKSFFNILLTQNQKNDVIMNIDNNTLSINNFKIKKSTIYKYLCFQEN